MKTKTVSPLPIHLQRFVLGFVGLGVLSMIVSLGYISITQPSIVLHNVATEQTASSEPTNNVQAVVAELMQRIDENPNDFEALVVLSEHLLHTEEWEQAESFIRRAITLKPNAMKPYYLLGIIQHKTGLHEEAAKSLEHALTLEDTASLRYNLGVLYAFFLHDEVRAKAMLEKALKAPEGNPSLTEAIQDVMQQLVKPS